MFLEAQGQERDTTSISGKVTDGLNTPFPDVTVSLYEYDEATEVFTKLHNTKTDVEGAYQFSAPAPSEYYVRAFLEVGWNDETEWYRFTKWYGDTSVAEDAHPVITVGSETHENIDIIFPYWNDTGSLSGRIVDADGNPVAQAVVRPGGSGPGLSYVGNFVSDKDGYFEAERVPAGTYTIQVEYRNAGFTGSRRIYYGQAKNYADAERIELSTNSQVVDLDVMIPRAEGAISGLVLGAQGKPLGGADIRFNTHFHLIGDGEEYFEVNTKTDSWGRFRIEGIPNSADQGQDFFLTMRACSIFACYDEVWQDSLSNPGVIRVENGESIPASFEFQTPLELGSGSISGTLYHVDGQPLSYTFVNLNGIDIVDSHGLQTRTDSAGAYRFFNLPAGTYQISASYFQEGLQLKAWFDDVATQDEATSVPVAENESVTGIDFYLDDRRSVNGTITGTVIDDKGQPIKRAYVEATSYRGATYDYRISPAEWYGISDEDGYFEICNLPPSTYMISAFAQDARLVQALADTASLEYVTLERYEKKEVLLEMQTQNEGNGIITGRINGSSELPLETAIVKAYAFGQQGAPFYTAVIDENGQYRFEHLPNGSYILKAQSPWHISTFYSNSPFPSNVEPIHVDTEQPVVNVDFSLSPFFCVAIPGSGLQSYIYTSTFWGTVTDISGQPLADASLFVVDKSGVPLLSGETNNAGQYEIPDVPPGNTYRILATHPGYAYKFNSGAIDVGDAWPLVSNGRFEPEDFVLTRTAEGTDSEPLETLPDQLRIHANYPNPFDVVTNIPFTLPGAVHVTVDVFDALGRRIEQLIARELPPGFHLAKWAPKDRASGIYFYRVQTEHETATGMMTVRK
ncbi:MAG: carboxypeptidase regulatory-like domain-containing protein [Bacteroidota bacterium]